MSGSSSTPDRPGAAQHGLHNLIEHFVLSAEDILARHRPPNASYTSSFHTSPRTREDTAVADLWKGDGAVRQDLEQDRNLRFVLDSFDGDLFQGICSSTIGCGFRFLCSDDPMTSHSLARHALASEA